MVLSGNNIDHGLEGGHLKQLFLIGIIGFELIVNTLIMK